MRQPMSTMAWRSLLMSSSLMPSLLLQDVASAACLAARHNMPLGAMTVDISRGMMYGIASRSVHQAMRTARSAPLPSLLQAGSPGTAYFQSRIQLRALTYLDANLSAAAGPTIGATGRSSRPVRFSAARMLTGTAAGSEQTKAQTKTMAEVEVDVEVEAEVEAGTQGSIRAPQPRMQAPSADFKVPEMVEAPHPATLSVETLQRQCQVTHTRRSGPGGQHRNKVSTAVVLKHTPTQITASASEARSQQQNLVSAYSRLRLRFALLLRTERTSGPTTLWNSRCKGGKIAINEKHEDFPCIIAEALDYIWQLQDVKQAAEALGLTTSQMVKLLAKEPPALAWVNAMRQSKGQPTLKPNK